MTSRKYSLLRQAGTLVAIEAEPGERPVFLYCGPDFGPFDPASLALLSTRQHAPGGADVHLPGSLLNELGTGVSGPSGLLTHRRGRAFGTDLRVDRIERPDAATLAIHLSDANAGIDARHDLAIDPDTGTLSCSTTIANRFDAALSIDWCAAMCVPLDDRLSRLFGFTGRWADEFRIEEIGRFRGSYVRENKAGRTSHDCFPGLLAAAETTSETGGLAASFHLGWSGNNRVRVDRHNDGRTILQMGEYLFPGEIELAQGESYTSPTLYASWSTDGLSGNSQKLHRYVEGPLLDQRSQGRPRPVHYNTWEAIYFDHSHERLMALVDEAAAVGAERFVLDDGWFGGRRHDRAGLGDWWVSRDVYPDGLRPLVERVHKHGMEFGLWFEPEMVNPDSDLYRAHPDWVLRAEGVEPVPFRGQLTLDLTRAEVSDYLFEKMTAVIGEYDVRYVKWDMNRDANHPGSGDRAAIHRQTRAVYALIDRLRAAHPALEIESCSSGGARVDYGILQRTDRFWASDNNDARTRRAIQRGASHFFPLRITGSHVGPKRCHITGRVFSMEFRAGTAIFGHMGMELNLLEESEDDRATLASAIALHKQHRDLIHGGDFYRVDAAPYLDVVGCVATDGSEALFSCAQLEPAPETSPARIRLAGLTPNSRYRLRLVWPDRNVSITSPSIVEAADLLGEGRAFHGAELMEYGLQLPLVFPDTCLIFHLVEETAK